MPKYPWQSYRGRHDRVLGRVSAVNYSRSRAIRPTPRYGRPITSPYRDVRHVVARRGWTPQFLREYLAENREIARQYRGYYPNEAERANRNDVNYQIHRRIFSQTPMGLYMRPGGLGRHYMSNPAYRPARAQISRRRSIIGRPSAFHRYTRPDDFWDHYDNRPWPGL